MKYIKNKKILLSFFGIILGLFLWVTGAELMEEEISILNATYSIAGGALLFISEGYGIHKILELEYVERTHKVGIYTTAGSDNVMTEDLKPRNSSLHKKTHYMKSDKKIIALCVSGIISGIALAFLPVILWNTESSTFGAPCVLVGMGLFGWSLMYLETHKLKLRRPELFRSQEIELKDERNIIIRDKASSKALVYLWSMIGISYFVYEWFDLKHDYVTLIMFCWLISVIIYIGHLYYYKMRL